MESIKLRRVTAGIAILMIAFAAISLADGPIPATATRNNTGNPINGTSGGLQTSSTSSLPSGPSSNAGGSVPGANNNDGTIPDNASSVVHERGVAGSGLPRENVSVVDTKSLPSTKTDGKFDTSLLGSDLKSVKDMKTSGSTQKEKAVTKTQTSSDKSTASAKASEKSSTSHDSAKPAEAATNSKP